MEWKAQQEDNREACGDAWIESGYVFTRDTGEQMNPDSLTRWLSDFSQKRNLPHIHPHAFRHTAATIMVSENMDIVTVAGELGHADPHTTMQIYAHEISLAKAKAGDIRRKLIKR